MNSLELYQSINRQIEKLDRGQSPEETLEKIRDTLVVFERARSMS